MELLSDKDIFWGMCGLCVFLAGLLYRLLIDYWKKIFEGINERLEQQDITIDKIEAKIDKILKRK